MRSTITFLLFFGIPVFSHTQSLPAALEGYKKVHVDSITDQEFQQHLQRIYDPNGELVPYSKFGRYVGLDGYKFDCYVKTDERAVLLVKRTPEEQAQFIQESIDLTKVEDVGDNINTMQEASKKEGDYFPFDVPLFCPGHIYVKASINSVEGYFLIDNGTPVGSLAKDALNLLGLTHEYSEQRELAQIELNERAFKLEFYKGSPLDEYNKNTYFPTQNYFGVLGTNLLNLFTVSYNFPESKISLYPIDVPITELIQEKGEIIPITYGLQGHTFFEDVKIGSKIGLLHFDTGIPFGDGFAFDQEQADSIGIKGHTLPEVRLGNISWHNEPWFGRYFRDVHGDDVIAEIGNGLLATYNVIISPGHKQGVLIRDNFIDRGGKGGIKLSAALIIESIVRDDIQKKIGWKVGDKITHVNGNVVNTVSEFRHEMNTWNLNQGLTIDIIRTNEKLSLKAGNLSELFR